MAKYIRYKGEFLSRAGVVWRVEILQEADSAFGTIGDLTFDAEEALVIEWSTKAKEEPVCGSTATIRIESPGDRTYTDLYTIAPGNILLRVYRNGALYWCGSLDPEFYEEPYERLDKYDVSLTFSDFGNLERIKYGLTGKQTLRRIVEYCLESAGLSVPVDESLISLCKGDVTGGPLSLSGIIIPSNNFYDEDGEALSLKEVLEGILQPLGLRIVQRAGTVSVYDLNGLYNAATEEVEWTGDSQTLGTDKVYNNVRINYSPYDDGKVIDGKLNHDSILKGKIGSMYYVETPDVEKIDGFLFCFGEQDGLPLTLSNGARYFRIDSEYSGSDEAGVAWAAKGNNTPEYHKDLLNRVYTALSNGISISKPIITLGNGYIGHSPQSDNDFRLKISLDLLFDVRYNPFESEGKHNEEGNYSRLHNWCNFAYIPVMLYLKDDAGEILYHYENAQVMKSNTYTTTGQWKSGKGSWGCMYLCYYDFENRKNRAGLGGWQANRQIIGFYQGKLPEKWKKQGTGELLRLPPTSGYLELQIGSGIYQFDYNREEKDIYSRIRWFLYKNPAVELVKANGRGIDSNDIEYSGYLNKDAFDELSISTICGTSADPRPAARGNYIFADTAQPLREVIRAGVKDLPERLLIGTLYSQYADRKTTLSGECAIDAGRIKPYTEANQPGKKFIMSGDVQNVITDTSEGTFIELNPDEYEAIEEVES